jgi:hypothetical protein
MFPIKCCIQLASIIVMRMNSSAQSLAANERCRVYKVSRGAVRWAVGWNVSSEGALDSALFELVGKKRALYEPSGVVA